MLAGRAAAEVMVDGGTDHADSLGFLLEALLNLGDPEDPYLRVPEAELLSDRIASEASLDAPADADWLLRLRGAGMEEAARVLACRAATVTSLEIPWEVASLLETLRDMGEYVAAQDLATRAAAETRLKHPRGLARLLREV